MVQTLRAPMIVIMASLIEKGVGGLLKKAFWGWDVGGQQDFRGGEYVIKHTATLKHLIKIIHMSTFFLYADGLTYAKQENCWLIFLRLMTFIIQYICHYHVINNMLDFHNTINWSNCVWGAHRPHPTHVCFIILAWNLRHFYCMAPNYYRYT